jgi:hypothetical protein
MWSLRVKQNQKLKRNSMRIKTITGEGENYVCDSCMKKLAIVDRNNIIYVERFTHFRKLVLDIVFHSHWCVKCCTPEIDKRLHDNGWELMGVYEPTKFIGDSTRFDSLTIPMNFQARVDGWLLRCFGEEIARDKAERNHRFLEEALELAQSIDCTKSEAHQLVDYVFDRPAGEPAQECGGVMVTLAALCLANGLDMKEAGEKELARVWGKIDKIREKQANKPKHSPLPQQQDGGALYETRLVLYRLLKTLEKTGMNREQKKHYDEATYILKKYFDPTEVLR